MKIPARLFIFVISLFIIHYSLFISPVSAQTANPNITSNTNPTVPNNLHTWTQNVMIEVMAAATCQIAGVDPINPNQKCLGVDPKTNSIGFVPSAGSGQVGGGGAIGVMSNFIAMTFTPPLHTGDYFSYLAQNFGIAKPAFAQVTGFSSLKPLMDLWIAFRNIVYLLFVLVFVVIGVAIMLRVKIDPRTVMTIENQIPKIIIGLLLVTFSFAIAGFLVDLMWVSIYLVFGIISGIPNVNLSGISPSSIQGANPIEAANGLNTPGGIFGLTTTVTTSVVGVIMSFLGLEGPLGGALRVDSIMNILIHALSTAGGIFVGIQLAQVTQGLLSFFLPTNLVAGAVTGLTAAAGFEVFFRNILPNVIVFLVIFIAILMALFRLWFELIKAYIFILIDVVIAPFFIVLGLFPGSPISFGTWMRDIVANLSAFPVTIAMFLLGRVFIESFGTVQPGNQFVPPLIGNPSAIDTMKSLIGLGIILMTPQVVNMMKEMLKAPQFKYGAAIGQAIGVSPGLLGGGLSLGGQLKLLFPGLPLFKAGIFQPEAPKPNVSAPTTPSTSAK